MSPWCQNARDNLPECKGEPDERYTMEFSESDTGQPGGSKLYFCSACGPVAHELERALATWLKEPSNLERLEDTLRDRLH
jgi:hypothetical protein